MVMGRTVHACLRLMSWPPCWCLQALKTRGTGCQLNFDEAVYSGLLSLMPSVTVVSIIYCHMQLALQSTAAHCAVQSEQGLLLALLFLQAGTSGKRSHPHVNLQQSFNQAPSMHVPCAAGPGGGGSPLPEQGSQCCTNRSRAAPGLQQE